MDLHERRIRQRGYESEAQMIEWILGWLSEVISFILGAIVMLIMGIGALYNKAQMKRKDDGTEAGK